jgi:beta-glucosidase-like glycosyl hydrolase
MNDIAQLFMPAIRWDSARGYDTSRDLIGVALERGVGGFILFGGERDAVRQLTAELRGKARVPLLIGADLERGAGQQFSGAIGLPPLAAIASLGDPDAIRGAAALTAREARTLGINWIYAPVCDVDSEPENPIVGTRSFGSDPHEVAIAATHWIDACQGAGVLACAKHFPGHGRTTTDSHAELPTVGTPAKTLAESDLVPFKAAVNAGVATVMTAHVAYPALDPSGVPATLSRTILHGLLREQIGFPGLVVTDALIMEGVLGGGETTAVVRALGAGCDLLLYPTDLVACIDAVDAAIERGDLDQKEIALSLERRKRWADWATSERHSVTVTRDDAIWAEQLSDRVVHRMRGDPPTLGDKVEVIVVDDDVGGPYPPPSRQPFVETLRENGFAAEVVDTPSRNSGTSVVIALFGDIRSWKGRPGYSARALDAVRAALEAATTVGRQAIIVQFSHPRLAATIHGDAPILCAWGGEAVMQRAATRVLSGTKLSAPTGGDTGAAT